MADALRIWCNHRFPPDVLAALARAVHPHRLLLAERPVDSNLAAGSDDETLADADVALGQPPVEAVAALPGLRFIHLTSAGYERYDRPSVRETLAARGAVLTTSSTVYAEPCAEHALAMMLALARALPDSRDEQGGARGWPAAERRAASRLLLGQRMVLLGFGAIARRLVELLAPFRVEVAALRRHARGDERVTIVDPATLPAALATADHVVDLLPGGEATRHFVDASLLAAMKPGARFYNVGRGSTVDQEALAAALRSGRLGAACLDVTEPEPLPPDHPLWTTPGCLITPHSAGGRDGEAASQVAHFLDNLARFVRGETLIDRVM